jgi:alkylated DNA repair dioxygenase AlkB
LLRPFAPKQPAYDNRHPKVMSTQFKFFESSEPEGLRYLREVINAKEEQELVQQVSALPFREFEFHGFLGKRRIVSFGWKYDYSGGGLQKADDIPEFLFELRARAAAFANLNGEDFQHALVTEYQPGAGIGWHRDKPQFGDVVGISLLAPCVLRFRRKLHSDAKGSRRQWERMNVSIERRSAYHLSGPARWEWYHSILRVDSLRYAITFRNVQA